LIFAIQAYKPLSNLATILFCDIQKNYEQSHVRRCDVSFQSWDLFITFAALYELNTQHTVSTPEIIEAYITHTMYIHFKKDLKLEGATANICVCSRGCNITSLAAVQYNMQYINDGMRSDSFIRQIFTPSQVCNIRTMERNPLDYHHKAVCN
jgi:hypothetical protein